MSRSQFQAYLKSVECGSLTGAARALGYTQSGITHLLNTMEKELGMKLLVREKSGAYPTAEGLEMMPFIQDVTAAYDNLDRKAEELKHLDSGLVRVGGFSSVTLKWLPGILAEFQKNHSGINVVVKHGTDEENYRWLKEGKTDCAFVTEITDTPFDVFALAKDPLVVILPKEHELAAKQRIDREDLMTYPYIKLMDGNLYEVEEVARVFSREDIQPKVKYEEVDDNAVIAMVAAGLGISMLPKLSTRGSENMVEIRPTEFEASRNIGIAVKNGARMTGAVEEFIRTVMSWVSRDRIYGQSLQVEELSLIRRKNKGEKV